MTFTPHLLMLKRTSLNLVVILLGLFFILGSGGTPVITILGDNPVTIQQGSVYVDAGATAEDDDGPRQITTITGLPIDTSVVGTFKIVYSVLGADGKTITAERVVHVVKTVIIDTIPPVITILGDNPASVEQGETYTDAGATALDNIDGNVTVSVSSTVTTTTAGEYAVTYTANDSSGNTTIETRVVNVMSSNTIPEAKNASVVTDESTPIDITLEGTDKDGNALTYQIKTSPHMGGLSVVRGNEVTYVPASGRHGDDSFTFIVNNGKDDSVAATIQIKVNSTDEVPQAREPLAEDIITLSTGKTVIRSEIIINKKDSATHAQVLELISNNGWELVGYIEFLGRYQIDIKSNNENDLHSAITQARSSTKIVDFAFSNSVAKLNDAANQTFYTNDEFLNGDNYKYAWALTSIHASDAWELLYKNKIPAAVKIGVLDGGFGHEHEDLKLNRIFTTTRPVTGYTYTDRDKVPDFCQKGPPEKKCGELVNKCHAPNHGMNVAGIISAAGNNKKGIAGVAYKNRMKPLVFTTQYTKGLTEKDELVDKQTIMTGFVTLAKNRARIINYSSGTEACVEKNECSKKPEKTCSLISLTDGDFKKEIEEYAKNIIKIIDTYDVLLVHSSGNSGDGTYNDNGKEVDAPTDINGTVASATADNFLCENEKKDKKCTSNITKIRNNSLVVGSYYVDALKNKVIVSSTQEPKLGYKSKIPFILAPGGNIDNGVASLGYEGLDSYTVMSGTSQAAPYVTGVATLVLQSNPKVSASEVQKIILLSADTKNNSSDIKDDYRYLNAERAVKTALFTKKINKEYILYFLVLLESSSKINDIDELSAWLTENDVDINILLTFLEKNSVDIDALSASMEKYNYNIDNSFFERNKDSDSDGLSNVEELLIHKTNPKNDDTDYDDMLDSWEVVYKLNPLIDDANEDKDNDGFSNVQEYYDNTDPQDASSFLPAFTAPVLKIKQLDSDTAKVEWKSNRPIDYIDFCFSEEHIPNCDNDNDDSDWSRRLKIEKDGKPISFDFNGLVENKKYYFWAVVRDINTSSPRSNMVSITMQPDNELPTANAGDDKVIDNSNNNILLDGSGSSDTDGSIESYLWKKGESILGTGKTLSIPALPIGNHVINLVVTDNKGGIASDEMIITVIDYVAGIHFKEQFSVSCPQNIIAENSMIYVLSCNGRGSHKLTILDTTNPKKVEILSSITIPPGANKFELLDQTLYMHYFSGDYGNGSFNTFIKVDVTNPAAPIRIDESYKIMGFYLRELFTKNNKLFTKDTTSYIGKEVTLKYSDISNLTTKVPLSIPLQRTDEFEIPHDWIIDEDKLLVLFVKIDNDKRTYFLRSYDISDTDFPVLKGEINLGFPVSLKTINNNKLYLSRTYGSTIDIIDYSDIANLVNISPVLLEGAISVDGNFIYNIHGYNNIQIFDISNPINKTIFKYYNYLDYINSYSQKVLAYKNTSYLFFENKIGVLNTNSTISEFALKEVFLNKVTMKGSIVDNKLMLFAEKTIKIFNLDTDSNLSSVYSDIYREYLTLNNYSINKNHIYILNHQDKVLENIDYVNNTTSNTSLEFDDNAHLLVNMDRMYVLNSDHVNIYDVSEPKTLTFIGKYDIQINLGNNRKVIKNNYLALQNHAGGVSLHDLSIYKKIGSLSRPNDDAALLSISEDRLYVSNKGNYSNNDIGIYNLSNFKRVGIIPVRIDDIFVDENIHILINGTYHIINKENYLKEQRFEN